MGIKKNKNNKLAYILESKGDCVLYLMHLLEYAIKKKEIFHNNLLYAVTYLAGEVEHHGINLRNDENMSEFVFSAVADNLNFEVDFYRCKLFVSALNLSKNEIYNLIGDYSKDKRAISYYNYHDIITKKRIEGVKVLESKEKTELLKKCNGMRNYQSHFTSDKLIEWIKFRENQLNEKGYPGFYISTDFNVYISNKIPVKFLLDELRAAHLFYFDILKIIDYMTKDFNLLIDNEININIKDKKFDDSSSKISQNGIQSHMTSMGKSNMF